MRPFSNTMTLQFTFQPANAGPCANVVPTNLHGAILKDSYLDITGIPHSAVLPNLELFANAGFPFTRKADLADTAIVMPDRPTAAELEMFLALIGHFSAQTGYPALRVTVINAAAMTADRARDHLVLGTVDDQPAINSLAGSMPVGVDANGMHIRDVRGLFDRAAWGRVFRPDTAAGGELATSGGLPEALIEGLEWPAGSSRSVVMVVLRDQAVVPIFVSAFLKTSQSSAIAESVSVLNGGQFSSSRIGTGLYRVGENSLLQRLTRTLQQFPWLIALVAVIFCFLIATLLQAMLRRRARMRLQGPE
jgi:cellulose synthase (UDP-forming)